MLLVAGEALIDLLPVEGVADGSGGGVLEPAVGGSPFNVALAAGRLGMETRFLNRISRDGFGEKLAGALEASGVELGLCPRVEALTTLGLVRFPKGDGVAEYAFYTQGTAGVGPEVGDLPEVLPGGVEMVHVGSFALAVERVGPVLEELLAMAGRERLVSFDVNVRAFLVEDEAGYRARVERVLDRADVVKVSDEDLEWLAPGVAVDAWVAGCLERGVKLVLVTLGEKGAVAVTRGGRAEVGAVEVEVVDTVGAGDTFMAAVLAWLAERDGGGIETMDGGELGRLLEFAARAAAVTCSRKGCDPPRRDEVVGT